MKELRPRTLLIFLLIVAFISPHCTRNEDYVEKYLGSWDFRYISKTTNSTTGTESVDTIYFTGVINAGTAEDELIIQYTDQLNMTLHVGRDGIVLTECMQPSRCQGEFTNDNLFHYTYSSRISTGQYLMFYNRIIDGEKISGESSLNKAPVVSTDSPIGIANSGARLNGSVIANYLSTNVYFEYGPTIKYGKSVTATPGPVTGNTKTTVNYYVSQLSPGTLYHFRTKAVNSMGTAYGSDSVFTTKALTDNVSDNEGNSYKTILIDDQLWMAENLRSRKFQNGDEIPSTKITMEDISGEAEPKYQWAYDGVESYSEIYGRLYTWYTVTDDRNICPDGWHVPSYEEVSLMINNIDQYNGGALKEAGFSHWKSPNTGATNATGFNGLPGGSALIGFMMINFVCIGESGNWWTSSFETKNPGSNSKQALGYGLINYGSIVAAYYADRRSGYSVRCIKSK